MGHKKEEKDIEDDLIYYKKGAKPNILSFPDGVNQAAYWRVLWPAYQMLMREFATYSISNGYIRDSLSYKASDVVQLQRVTHAEDADFIEKLCTLKKELDFRLIYDTDDVLIKEDIPNFMKIIDADKMDTAATKKVMELCDEVTVSTPYLREYYLSKTEQSNITVLPNRIPFSWAGNFYDEGRILYSYRENKLRPRILYAGGRSHVNCDGELGNDDLTHVIDAIKKTIKEFKWVFVGVLPMELVEYNESGDIEFYGLQSLDDYHKRIAILGCSMMITPLADNIFNHAKSDIKYQEACAHGLPMACQDITPYKHVPIRFTTGEQMVAAIRGVLKSEESLLAASRAARQEVDKYWLEVEENIGMHRELVYYSYRHKKRIHLNKMNNLKS